MTIRHPSLTGEVLWIVNEGIEERGEGEKRGMKSGENGGRSLSFLPAL